MGERGTGACDREPEVHEVVSFDTHCLPCHILDAGLDIQPSPALHVFFPTVTFSRPSLPDIIPFPRMPRPWAPHLPANHLQPLTLSESNGDATGLWPESRALRPD